MTAENFFKPSGAKIGIFFMIPVVGILIELIIASQNINFYGGISNSCKMGILWIPFAPVAINSCIHEIIVLNYDTAWYPYFYSKIISWLLTLAYWYLLACIITWFFSFGKKSSKPPINPVSWYYFSLQRTTPRTTCFAWVRGRPRMRFTQIWNLFYSAWQKSIHDYTCVIQSITI